MQNLTNSIALLIIGATLPTLGYFYKLSQDNKKNKKRALYYLLEVWHRVSILYKPNSLIDFDDLSETLGKLFPSIDFTEVMKDENLRSQLDSLLNTLVDDVQSKLLLDLPLFQKEYQSVISLISSVDPIFAYEMSNGNHISTIIELLDDYTQQLNQLETLFYDDSVDETTSELFDSVTHKISKSAKIEALEDLEKDILHIASKVSFFTKLKTRKTIKTRKEKLLNGPEETDISSQTEEVIGTVIQHFSDIK